MLNPVALRKAKIVCNFGLSECSRVETEIEWDKVHDNLPEQVETLSNNTVTSPVVIQDSMSVNLDIIGQSVNPVLLKIDTFSIEPQHTESGCLTPMWTVLGSDQHAHLHSLIRFFAVCTHP